MNQKMENKISEDEKSLIRKLRLRVFDILKPGENRSDYFLIRWIRAPLQTAHRGNIDKSEVHIRQHPSNASTILIDQINWLLDTFFGSYIRKESFEWRQEWKVDEILQKPWDYFMVSHYPIYMQGYDKNGLPVVYIPIGTWDFEKSLGKTTEFTEFVIQCLETMTQKIRESNDGNNPWDYQKTQLTFVVDWSGISCAKLLMNRKGLLLKFAEIFDTHYPEILHRAIYINCPITFHKIFAFIKLFLSDQTAAKIKTYGTNRAEWEPKLLQLISKEQLSTEYGGELRIQEMSLVSAQQKDQFTNI